MKNPVIIAILFMTILWGGCTDSLTVKNRDIDPAKLREQALDAVRLALVDESGQIKSNAAEVVATTGSKQLMPLVIRLLKDDSLAVRFAASAAIGDMRYSAGKYPVRGLMNDSNPNIRIAAAYALTRLGEKRYADVIRSATRSPDQVVRANAVLLLGKLGNPDDLGLLYQTLRDLDSSDSTKIQTLESIAKLGDEKVYQRLWALLISKYADDRVMGIKAMGALKTKDARDSLIKMLYDDITEVRLEAARQLAQLGDNTGRVEIEDYFKSNLGGFNKTSVANIIATMAIGRMGGDSLTRFLPGLLESKSMIIRLVAAQSVLLLTG